MPREIASGFILGRRTTLPRRAPVIFEIARSHERPHVFSLPEGSDVTVELYGGVVVLRLEGERRRVYMRRLDHCTKVVTTGLTLKSTLK